MIENLINRLDTAEDYLGHKLLAPSVRKTIHDANTVLSLIHAELDGKEWNAETPRAIANHLADYGLPVRSCVETSPAFLFHAMLNELVPGAAWRDDHDDCTTSASLQVEGHTATLKFIWPVHDAGWNLDCLAEDCRPMVNALLDTFNRHVAGGRVSFVDCYMNPRKAPTALSEPGWLEWGAVLRDQDCERLLYINHIQRTVGAQVERHS